MEGLSKEQLKVIELVEKQLLQISTLNIPEPDRSRCLLCLSYEYFVSDLEERAYELLQQADPNYFGDQLGEDIINIPNMKEIVLTITQKLVDLGVVNIRIPSND